jgi:large subunit ribosomal protein L6
MPIPVPAGVTVTIKDGTVSAKGPLGEMSRPIPPGSAIAQEGNELVVTPSNESRKALQVWGLTRSLIDNMVIGVSKGFSKTLQIQGTGYRVEDKKLKGKQWLQFALGLSHPILCEIPEGLTCVAEPKAGRVTLKGIDKELVGQMAAIIRGFRPPEPYKGKGIRYEGEQVRRKVGKAGTR